MKTSKPFLQKSKNVVKLSSTSQFPMTVFEKLTVADLPPRPARRSKTSPLRDAIQDMEHDDVIFVKHWDKDTQEGFKSSTISQVAGRMSKESDLYRYSIRSVPEKGGCHIICSSKVSND